MNWTDTLEREIGYTYGSAIGLMRLVDQDKFDWKPDLPEGAESTGWMTMAELLEHMTGSCGSMCEAFAGDDWSKVMSNQGAPPPKAASVDAAIAALTADRDKALAAVRAAGEERMSSEKITAPWGIEGTLGEQFLDSVKHLSQHKSQLFYYLKLLGKPVHTGHLWGMEG